MTKLTRTRHISGLPPHFYLDGKPVEENAYWEAWDRAEVRHGAHIEYYTDRLGFEAERHHCEVL